MGLAHSGVEQLFTSKGRKTACFCFVGVGASAFSKGGKSASKKIDGEASVDCFEEIFRLSSKGVVLVGEAGEG